MVQGCGTQGELGTNPAPVLVEVLNGWFHRSGGHHYLGYIVQTRSAKRNELDGMVTSEYRPDNIEFKLKQKEASYGSGLSLCTKGRLPLGGISKWLLHS